MQSHVHPAPPEADAFGLQSQALLDAGLATQLDFSSRAHNPVPREIERPMQRSHHLASRSGVAGGTRDRAVRGHMSMGNFANRS
jgi:hypothetical protein